MLQVTERSSASVAMFAQRLLHPPHIQLHRQLVTCRPRFYPLRSLAKIAWRRVQFSIKKCQKQRPWIRNCVFLKLVFLENGSKNQLPFIPWVFDWIQKMGSWRWWKPKTCGFVSKQSCNKNLTLPETNSSPLKIGRNPIGKACIPTIHGQTVSFREGKFHF